MKNEKITAAAQIMGESADAAIKMGLGFMGMLKTLGALAAPKPPGIICINVNREPEEKLHSKARGLGLSPENKDILREIKNNFAFKGDLSAFSGSGRFMGLGYIQRLKGDGTGRSDGGFATYPQHSLFAQRYRMTIDGQNLLEMRRGIFNRYEALGEFAQVVDAVAKDTGYGPARVKKLIKRAANKYARGEKIFFQDFLNFDFDDFRSGDTLAYLAESVAFAAILKRAQGQIVLTNQRFMRRQLREILSGPEARAECSDLILEVQKRYNLSPLPDLRQMPSMKFPEGEK